MCSLVCCIGGTTASGSLAFVAILLPPWASAALPVHATMIPTISHLFLMLSIRTITEWTGKVGNFYQFPIATPRLPLSLFKGLLNLHKAWACMSHISNCADCVPSLPWSTLLPWASNCSKIWTPCSGLPLLRFHQRLPLPLFFLQDLPAKQKTSKDIAKTSPASTPP